MAKLKKKIKRLLRRAAAEPIVQYAASTIASVLMGRFRKK
jgi:hypothetical protein